MRSVAESTGGESLARLTYSVPEVAQILGISRASAYVCVRSGDIPSITLGGADRRSSSGTRQSAGPRRTVGSGEAPKSTRRSRDQAGSV